MAIREIGGLGGDTGASRFTAEAAAETLRELEEQYAAGELDPQVYFAKKRNLVRLFLKATTAPVRKRRPTAGPFSDADYDGA